jgi:hypothetical protein
MGGSEATEPAAAAKRHSPANSLRPHSISAGVNSELVTALLCASREL